MFSKIVFVVYPLKLTMFYVWAKLIKSYSGVAINLNKRCEDSGAFCILDLMRALS